MSEDVLKLIRATEARNMLSVLGVGVEDAETHTAHLNLTIADRDLRHRLLLDILSYAGIDPKAEDVLSYTYSDEYYRSGQFDPLFNEFTDLTTGVSIRVESILPTR